MSKLKKYNKFAVKRLVKAQLSFQFLNCPAGCHKNHIALFDRDGEQLTAASDDPVKALSQAAHYFSELAAFLTEKQVVVANAGKAETATSEDKKSESGLPPEVAEILSLIEGMKGVKVSVVSRAKPAKTEPDQTAG